MTIDLDVDAGVLKVVAEPLRLRIVQLLAVEELCVCHLAEDLGVAQPLVSHHLRILRDAGLVATERYRYWTYYHLERERIAGLAAQLNELAAPPPMTSRRPCC